MAVIALSGDYVNAVGRNYDCTGSNNIGVTTPKAIIKTIQGAGVESSFSNRFYAFYALLIRRMSALFPLSKNHRLMSK